MDEDAYVEKHAEYDTYSSKWPPTLFQSVKPVNAGTKNPPSLAPFARTKFYDKTHSVPLLMNLSSMIVTSLIMNLQM